MGIKETFVRAIEGGGVDLRTMLGRVDHAFASGLIDADEHEELVELAQAKANPADSLPPAADRIAALELRVAALEAKLAEPEPEDPEAVPELPAWRQPTGAHDAYAAGDRVVWDGGVWESTADGNVWSPADYPQGWQKVEAQE